MANVKDLTGQRFGRLVATTQTGKNKWGNPMWLCKCDCGEERIVNCHNLLRGHSKSCGCLQREATSKANSTHGMRSTRLYRTWAHMRDRCYNPKDKRYDQYGGRGIKVCEEWCNSFQAFYEWAMENGYSDDLTIDRIDVNGNYEPSNCRWETLKAQANNRSNNRLICIDGESLTLSQWLVKKNMKKETFYERLRRGWSEEKALLTPVGGEAK